MTTTSDSRIGGSASPSQRETPSTDQLVHAGRIIVDHFHISFTTSRILRLAIQFKSRAPQGDKYLFFEFLSAQIHLTDSQKRAALSTPEIARVLVYNDPTGEQAVNNVLREQRRHA